MTNNNSLKKPRRHEISFLNVILCLTVIFIHIISYAVSGPEVGSVKYNIAMFLWRMSSFAVQGFILLSGVKFFLTKKDEMPLGRYFLSRLKAIVIPYAVLFVVYYAFYYVAYDYPLDIKFILKMFFSGSLVCHLYFIPLIIQFDLLAPLWKKLVNRFSGMIIVPFCLLLGQLLEIYLPDMVKISFPGSNFIYSDRIFTSYLLYWIAGCYIGKNYDFFLRFIKESFLVITVALCITLVIFGYYTYIAFNNIAYVPFMNQVHSLYVVCILSFLYAFSAKFGLQIMERIKLLTKIDRISYSIYLWHMLVIFFANYVLELFGIASQGLAFAVRAIIVYPGTIVWCLIVNSVKNKTKKFR